MSSKETVALSRLPRGPHRLTREDVSASQRHRLCWAAIEAVAERGYKPMTVADIVERAHVSRRTFYEMFDNRDDCFAAGFELAMEIVETKLDSAIENAENLRLREVLFTSLREYLTFLASEPAVARALHVETLSGDAALAEQRARMERVLSERIRAAYLMARADGADYPLVPDGIFDLLVGGIDNRIRDFLRTRGAADLPELAPLLHQAAMALLGRPEYPTGN
ncbi:TetR/AcrR family transcriptional regulator [Nocardia sp. NPDC056000]|uniref:TetR/AcrR family transcriptional regulator n=1 Tax=Nocardia sp. NPDC056000 TaxID=3345674 RepID=UPI0035DD15E2